MFLYTHCNNSIVVDLHSSIAILLGFLVGVYSSGITIIWGIWMENSSIAITCGYSGIAHIKRSWNWISFRSVITDNLAMEGFKAEELVRSIVFF
jgi:hypothetical protein